MNSFLLDFIKKTEEKAKKEVPPNPTKKTNALIQKPSVSNSFAEIVEDKPPAKQVLEYIKNRINEIYMEED